MGVALRAGRQLVAGGDVSPGEAKRKTGSSDLVWLSQNRLNACSCHLPRLAHWSLTSLQQRLVKTGGRLVKHARYYWLLLAEGHLTRRRFVAMLGRIALLPIPTG
jgi:hypothetical protein